MTEQSTPFPEILPLSFNWNKELLLIRGLPGSGKSTLAKQLTWNGDKAVVEADMFFMVGGKYLFHKDIVSVAHQWCQGEVFRRFWYFNRVAVANVFARRDQIFPYIELCRKYKIKLWVINSPNTNLPVAELAAKNVHSVPEKVIEDMRKSWEQISQDEINILLGLPKEVATAPLVVPSFEGNPEKKEKPPTPRPTYLPESGEMTKGG